MHVVECKIRQDKGRPLAPSKSLIVIGWINVQPLLAQDSLASYVPRISKVKRLLRMEGLFIQTILCVTSAQSLSQVLPPFIFDFNHFEDTSWLFGGANNDRPMCAYCGRHNEQMCELCQKIGETIKDGRYTGDYNLQALCVGIIYFLPISWT